MKKNNLEKAIKNFDFEDFLLNYSVDVELRVKELAGICPFCQWRRVSFYVDAEKGLWCCHFCNESGGPVQLISRIAECSYTRALDILFDNFIIFEKDYEEKEYKEIKIDSIQLPTEFFPLAKNDSTAALPYYRYANKIRGLDNVILKRYNIGYCATGFYRGRIIVPVYHFGTLVNFVARAISDKISKKVLTPKGNDQYKYCFNLDNLWGLSEVVLVEGVFDVLVIPDKAVATFGKKITVEQVALLKKAGIKEVTFCFDDDAIEEAYKFAQEYLMTFKTNLVEMPTGYDPSKLGKIEMLKLLQTAKPIQLNTLRT